jgi:hypothetical protein
MSEIKKSTGFSKPAKLAGSSGSAPAGKSQKVDMAQLFGAVAGTLAENRQSLNKADVHNHDHGDNMVQIFNLVTQVMQQNKSADPASQLAQASKALAGSQSGSAQLYAGGLAQAAKQFKGQEQVTLENALPLVQTLLGGGQAQAPAQGNMTADLLGALLGGGQAQPQAGGAGDLLGALLGAGGGQGTASAGQGPAGAELLGALMGGTDAQGNRQVDTGKLLSAGLNVGMAYLAAKQQGSSNSQALIGALLKGSPLGQSPHRAQSGALVADTMLSLLGAMSQKK